VRAFHREHLMDELLNRLDQLSCDWRGPASLEQIRRAEAALGYPFPPELVTLYRRHDGAEPTSRCRPWRLMPLDEVIDLHIEVPRQWPTPEEADEALPWRLMDVHPFWSDDNSNYAGIYASGPLGGTICFIDHEDTDFSPRYRSIRSFVRAIVDTAERGGDDDGCDMPGDWPSDQHVEEDRALAAALEAEMGATPGDDGRRAQRAMQFMTVLPTPDSHRLVPYLDDQDMWVQERAAKELGARGHAAAIPDLARIAEHGMHNGQMASIQALGRLRTPQARAELVRLAAVLPDDFGPYLGGALRECGCEVEFDKQCHWRYRQPGAAEWIPLR
jgi:hypothetical protein